MGKSADMVLEAPWQPICTISALAGVTVHLLIRPHDVIDGYGWTLTFSYIGLVTAFGAFVAEFGHSSIIGTLPVILNVAVSFVVGMFGSILLYRAFFHRLHRFPGPFAAKLSRLYAMGNAMRNLQAFKDTDELHKKYGDFVRVGPRELSVNRQSAISAIYGPPTRCLRQASNDLSEIPVNYIRDPDLHRKRKRVWERGLSTRATSTYEPRVAQKLDKLIAMIDAQEGKPVDATELMVFFAFDVMGDIGFARDFNMLDSGHKHPIVKGFVDNVAGVGMFGTVPWLMGMLAQLPGATGTYSIFTSWISRELNAKRKAFMEEKAAGKDQDPRDLITWLLKAGDEKDPGAPPGEMAWQEDARLVIIAGSDTVVAALANAVYFLTKYPAIYRKLQILTAKIMPTPNDWSYSKVKEISYLDWIIQETLRLRPSVPGGLPRQTSAAGLQIDEVLIPRNTIVSVPAYTIQRDERYWGADAAEFKPERWEKLSTDKVPWIPFTKGQFSCPGKNMAMMEIRMVLGRIALLYDLRFAPGEGGLRFEREAKDTFTMTVPELPVVFKRR